MVRTSCAEGRPEDLLPVVDRLLLRRGCEGSVDRVSGGERSLDDRVCLARTIELGRVVLLVHRVNDLDALIEPTDRRSGIVIFEGDALRELRARDVGKEVLECLRIVGERQALV